MCIEGSTSGSLSRTSTPPMLSMRRDEAVEVDERRTVDLRVEGVGQPLPQLVEGRLALAARAEQVEVQRVDPVAVGLSRGDGHVDGVPGQADHGDLAQDGIDGGHDDGVRALADDALAVVAAEQEHGEAAVTADQVRDLDGLGRRLRGGCRPRRGPGRLGGAAVASVGVVPVRAGGEPAAAGHDDAQRGAQEGHDGSAHAGAAAFRGRASGLVTA